MLYSIYSQLTLTSSVALQVYFTLEELSGGRWEHREQSHTVDDADGPLRSLVHRTTAGQVTGEEQALVAFDRALATSGAVLPSGACLHTRASWA